MPTEAVYNPIGVIRLLQPSHTAPGPRIHLDHPRAPVLIADALSECAAAAGLEPTSVVLVCIGTDRSTGDALGPLVGSRLVGLRSEVVHVYGTLEQPVHAGNLSSALEAIDMRHPGATVVAIDACLGKSEHVGSIGVRVGPLLPGRGVNKRLPPVGHIHVVGIVNVGGFMEYFVLQNTRLHLVMRMAEAIAGAVELWLGRLAVLSPPHHGLARCHVPRGT